MHHPGRPRTPVVERFNSKYAVDPATGCWVWTGSKTRKGYAMIGLGGTDGKTVPAHRFAYEHFVGPIPDGLVLDHKCRNRACVNPHHVEPVTNAENIRRGGNAVKTHCKRGHPLSGNNLLIHTHGGRNCRTCKEQYAAGYYQRNREAKKAASRAYHWTHRDELLPKMRAQYRARRDAANAY